MEIRGRTKPLRQRHIWGQDPVFEQRSIFYLDTDIMSLFNKRMGIPRSLLDHRPLPKCGIKSNSLDLVYSVALSSPVDYPNNSSKSLSST